MIARSVRLVSIVLVAGLSSIARADQFHFSAPDAPVEQARILEGVLLQETDDGFYVIRVEGGEVRVPKALVTKIESDGLTVAQLEQREADAREGLAQADVTRRQAQTEAAHARREAARDAAAAEASATADDAAIAELTGITSYDPVLHRLVTTESVFESELRRQLGGEIRRYVQRELRDDRRALRRALRRIR